jgi:glyoxylase-like metal-dependent hydrolase (beta-lactamase superfamily II)
MRLADGLAMLDVTGPVLGRIDVVHPVLVWDDTSITLIDTGFPRQWDQVRQAFEMEGVSLSQLSRIVLTHQDIDHIGTLPDLVHHGDPDSPIEVSAHAAERPYIQGERRLLKFTDEAIASIDLLPPEVPEQWKQGLKALMLNPPCAPVNRTLAEGDRLNVAGGLTVIETPGHTPGHISLYHERSRTLIAGDALTVADGQLRGPDPASTLDMETALRSLWKLASLPIDRIVCYHGGMYQGKAGERIAQLAR